MKRLPAVIRKEISSSPGYHEGENGVGVKMIAWIGVAVKK